jgi:hypothetical protein
MCIKYATKYQLFELVKDPLRILSTLGGDPSNMQISLPFDTRNVLIVRSKLATELPSEMMFELNGEQLVVPLVFEEFRDYKIQDKNAPL